MKHAIKFIINVLRPVLFWANNTQTNRAEESSPRRIHRMGEYFFSIINAVIFGEKITNAF